MFKVKNKNAIKNLSKKSYKSNKKRNLTAILAIMLTTVLFTAMFTVGLGLIKSIEYNTMRMDGGMAHGSIKYLNKEQVEKISSHELFKEVGLSTYCGYITDERLLKRPVELDYKNETDLKLGFIELMGGTLPVAENDIVLDTMTLDMLGLEAKAGQEITLETDIGKGQKIDITYNLCGWFEGESAFMTSIGLTSNAFIEKYLLNRGQNYNNDFDLNGSTNINYMFKDSLTIEKNTRTIIEESGYSNDETSADYVRYGINWSYMSTTTYDDSFGTIIAIALALLLVMFTGYLIIYNIFQISVIKDIRFYGLLKTIGTTGKQIHKILVGQALRMSVLGIPLGLLLGFLVGVLVLPLITSQISGGKAYTSFSPIIFIGSAVFALGTVLISCSKPAKTASKISPVEAVKYSGVDGSYTRKNKKSTNGAKLYKMAFSNLGRNKKRTIIAVISMSLSLVLMNTVFCLSKSFDLDKYVSNMISVDYQLAHASYFNLNYRTEETPVSENFANVFSSQVGFSGGGGIYTDYSSSIDAEYEGELTTFGMTYEFKKDSGKALNTDIYAMDKFVLENLEIVQGELDLDKLYSGDYILLGTMTDDFGNPLLEDLPFKIGDKVTLKELTDSVVNPNFSHYDYDTNQAISKDNTIMDTTNGLVSYFYEGKKKEYEILGIYAMDYTNTSRNYGANATFAMPIEEFIAWDTDPKMMTYLANVEDGYHEMFDNFIEQYTTKSEPTMDYVSRESYKSDFFQMKNILLTVGGILSIIIGLIGLLNFANSISTGIIARQKELAMLNSIGMTRIQLKMMLICEGFYYAFLTIIFSLLIEIISAFTIIKTVIDGIWFLSFSVTFMPILIASILLLIFAIIIPISAYRSNQNVSVVEQLRMVD